MAVSGPIAWPLTLPTADLAVAGVRLPTVILQRDLEVR